MASGTKTATVQASQVPSTQSNIPLYVDLSALGITTQAEADSVRVYSGTDEATEWAREIVSASVMWVKVPSMTSSTAIYINWDGVRSDYAVTATYGRNAVWSNGYAAVYHLENLTTDSTGNLYTLTNNNTVTSGTGKIGGCGSFNGSNQYLGINNNIGIDGGACTISAWVNPNSASQVDGVAETGSAASDVNNVILYHGGVPATWFDRHKYGAAQDSSQISGSRAASTWHQFTYSYNGSTVTGYVNGTAGSGTSASGNGNNGNTNHTEIGFARRYSLYWDGLIDEVHFSTVGRSADWIEAQYNNQNSNSGFWGTWSDYTPSGGGGTVLPQFTPFSRP